MTEDPFFIELTKNYSPAEVEEIRTYLTEWAAATYLSVSHNILDHAERKQIDPLKLLRKAHNFNKKGATRIPRRGFRDDDSAVYRKNNEYLIIRVDQFGNEKIVTYGVNRNV
ncbi:hypothetical protein [[Limnothrix rosea] IAM M-220]|uniref:hypothetical protein n=1 Tax=[Limnothrix rosea] IAM M-220 TaxID=454133 RepID=UPI0009637CC0|nr:hypothetical protein [[Limnothrix rosea] IAM M-220]OKH17503.1 hypothetical protein NIES208_09185 [[Limnothrix rosea] IAM M-220]